LAFRATEDHALQAAPNLGFLTVVQEHGGYLGGYLVTNHWGRPLEFRLTTSVQPNRVQQILYGGTLKAYIHAELIGKTLVEKTGIAVQLVVTDCEPVLDLRLHCSVPVVWLAKADNPLVQAMTQAGAGVSHTAAGSLICHPKYTSEVPGLRTLLQQIDAAADLAEPFARIREALGEARKMGATSRAA
jgi:hypothetical protein